MDFDTAFVKLLGHEGKYSNHPDDPGGETCWGIIVSEARAWGYTGPMKDLPVEIAKAIYKAKYWDKIRADELPEEIRFDLFDGSVNSGPQQAVKWLQRACDVLDDGVVGIVTIAAAQNADPIRLTKRMNGQRLKFMTDLPTWPVFGRGWARRIAENLMG